MNTEHEVESIPERRISLEMEFRTKQLEWEKAKFRMIWMIGAVLAIMLTVAGVSLALSQLQSRAYVDAQVEQMLLRTSSVLEDRFIDRQAALDQRINRLEIAQRELGEIADAVTRGYVETNELVRDLADRIQAIEGK